MTELTLLLGTGLALGALHAFGPDHLAAVSVFVSRRPSWRRAAGLGAGWALGHSATILLLGGAVVLAGLRLPEPVAPLAERAVGAVLIVLGGIAVARALRLHAHWHEHDGAPHWHVHSHRRSRAHDHSHAALVGVGMLHGVAGSGALVVAVPAALPTSRAHSVAFLAAFGVGTVIAMCLFSGAAGLLFSSAMRRSAQLHRTAVAAAGLASAVVGTWWLVAATS